MITVRKSKDRGRAQHGWLDSHHTFSFADYMDEAFMGHRALRVINEDRVAPGQGFGRHAHRDMEIISYVVEGSLAHQDSMGNGESIVPGDVQVMSAGTGVMHSEFNGSKTSPVHFLQIWLLPNARGLTPGYAQKHFDDQSKLNRVRLLASPDGKDGSLVIHADALLYGSKLDSGESVVFHPQHPFVWVQMVKGNVQLSGTSLSEGDGAAIEGETALNFQADTDSEFLLFDLA